MADEIESKAKEPVVAPVRRDLLQPRGSVIPIALICAGLAVWAITKLENFTWTAVWPWLLFIAGVGGLAGSGAYFVVKSLADQSTGTAEETGPLPSSRIYVPLTVLLTLSGLATVLFGVADFDRNSSSTPSPWIYLAVGAVLIIIGLAVQSYSPTGPDLFQSVLQKGTGLSVHEFLIVAGTALALISTLYLFNFSSGAPAFRSVWASLVAAGALLTMFAIARQAANSGDTPPPRAGVFGARSAVRRAELALEIATRAADAAEELALLSPPEAEVEASAGRGTEADIRLRLAEFSAQADEAARRAEGAANSARQLLRAAEAAYPAADDPTTAAADRPPSFETGTDER